MISACNKLVCFCFHEIKDSSYFIKAKKPNRIPLSESCFVIEGKDFSDWVCIIVQFFVGLNYNYQLIFFGIFLQLILRS